MARNLRLAILIFLFSSVGLANAPTIKRIFALSGVPESLGFIDTYCVNIPKACNFNEKKSCPYVVCTQGGGDCTIQVLIRKVRKNGKRTQFQIDDNDGKLIWLDRNEKEFTKKYAICRMPKDAFSTLPSTKAPPIIGNLHINPGLGHMYLDKGLKKKVSGSPLGYHITPSKDEFFEAVPKFKKKGTWYTGFKVYAVTSDVEIKPDEDVCDFIDSYKVNRKKVLKSYYFPMFSKKGHINYWSSDSTCS